MEKAREFQKNIYFCFTDYAKGFDCVDHNKPWKIIKDPLGHSLGSKSYVSRLERIVESFASTRDEA